MLHFVSRWGLLTAVVALATQATWGRAWAEPACVASAEQVVAWDAEADLYVVASYLERDRPPGPGARVFPNLLELRRLSTGAQVDLVNCASQPGALRASSAIEPCDFRVLFGARIPRRALFKRQGTRLDPNRVAIKPFAEGPDRAFALVARAKGASAWHRVMWLGDEVMRPPERMNIRIIDGEHWQQEVLVVIEITHQGGTCRSTEARVLRVREIDLDQPAALEHQKHLLVRLKESSPFAEWRSAAEIAPLPPNRLVNAMVVAAEAGKPDFAAHWWTATTTGLPLDQVAALAGALRDRPELRQIVAMIRLPAPPQAEPDGPPAARDR